MQKHLVVWKLWYMNVLHCYVTFHPAVFVCFVFFSPFSISVLILERTHIHVENRPRLVDLCLLIHVLTNVQDIPIVKMADKPPARVPGYVMKIPSPPTSAVPKDDSKVQLLRTLSEDEARKLDEECYERFIKVCAQYICEGFVSVSFLLADHEVGQLNIVLRQTDVTVQSCLRMMMVMMAHSSQMRIVGVVDGQFLDASWWL